MVAGALVASWLYLRLRIDFYGCGECFTVVLNSYQAFYGCKISFTVTDYIFTVMRAPVGLVEGLNNIYG